MATPSVKPSTSRECLRKVRIWMQAAKVMTWLLSIWHTVYGIVLFGSEPHRRTCHANNVLLTFAADDRECVPSAKIRSICKHTAI